MKRQDIKDVLGVDVGPRLAIDNDDEGINWALRDAETFEPSAAFGEL